MIIAQITPDPTSPHTDHTREYVPALWFNEKTEPKALGLRKGFYDLGATVAGVFGVTEFGRGRGFEGGTQKACQQIIEK